MKMNFGFQLRKLARLKIISLPKRTIVSQGGVKNGSIISTFSFYETKFNKNELIKTGTTSNLMCDKYIFHLSENISDLSVKDGILRSSIIEPRPQIKINIGLPLIDLVRKDFKLPSLNDRELIDPTSNVVEKKAKKSIIRIRRRKMNRHKYKKRQKRMKYIFARIKKKRKANREKEFVRLISDILDSGKDYNPEKELDENMDILLWKRPVTHVRGCLAPKSVVDEYLKEKEIEDQVNKRVEECLSKMKS